jgi:cytochrome c-type biogenesis protein CcmH/NrfG
MKRTASPFSAMNAVTGLAGVLLGVITGYILGAGQVQGSVPAAAAAAVAAAPGAADPHVHLVNEQELQAYKDILAADPKNVKAAIELGNKLYDAGRYSDAIPYYQQALAVDGKNVNVSTDLATALYYAGRVDEALTQMDVSLRIDPAHGQTLFNVGIIKRDAKKDKAGAVAAWERLLQVAPNYPEASKVRTLIAETRG